MEVILICIGIGLILSLAIAGGFASQHKTVHHKASASDYMRPGSFTLHRREDDYLYSNTTRVKRSKSS